MRDVMVVGAGPAGLSAACAALDAGARVTLVDGSDQLGGQYWRHPSEGRPLAQHGWSTFEQLRAAVLGHPHCVIMTSAQVWAIERLDRSVARAAVAVHLTVGVADGRDRRQLRMTPSALVLATGAHDRTLPFPGWDLPGVLSAGAAQALAKGDRIAVGRRVVVAGAGPFLLPVAASLVAVGARVVGVHEAAGAHQLTEGWLRRPWELARSVGKAPELLGYVGGHLRHRIPYSIGSAVIAASGNDRVESVTVAQLDAHWAPRAETARQMPADAVCVSHAFVPRLELPMAAGCALSADRFVRVSDDQQTTVPGVYAAGELTGIAGAAAALAEGAVAGHCAAGASVHAPELRRVRRSRASQHRFAARMATAHRVGPAWIDWLTENTLICRCEEVTFGALSRIREMTGSTGLRSLKLTTRAGLGHCQGRICGRTVEDLLRSSGPGLTHDASTDRRPLASPIRLGELARDHLQRSNQPTKEE